MFLEQVKMSSNDEKFGLEFVSRYIRDVHDTQGRWNQCGRYGSSFTGFYEIYYLVAQQFLRDILLAATPSFERFTIGCQPSFSKFSNDNNKKE